MKNKSSFVFGFQEIDKTYLALAGGKGANLGELARIKGIRVPDGFCIAAEAFKRAVEHTPGLSTLIDRLSLVKAGDREQISALGTDIRKVIAEISIPQDIREDITGLLSVLGAHDAYAIRSSATAEDLPSASFAGQQDTYLNIKGEASILEHIALCWASLFTDRAIIYRIQNRFDHHKVYLAVIIQKMIFPDASGILFTADPLNCNRKVVSIDAGFGLGEALVSGLVDADQYKIQEDIVKDKKIATKKLAVYALEDGGTHTQAIAPERQQSPALTDDQAVLLAQLGRTIEAHFGSPQDIEWCLARDTFYIVQSRPITTLFPVPEQEDTGNHVYVSVGHNQMMTDAIKPLGLSFFQLTTARPMSTAGGRLFVDITNQLASPASRERLMEIFGTDQLLKDALSVIIGRKDFIQPVPGDNMQSGGYIEKELPWSYLEQFENKPDIASNLVKQNEASVSVLKENIRTKSGTTLFDFILEDIQELKKLLFNPQSWEVIKVALYASSWVNEKMNEYLGEKSVADTLSQSVFNNITSEMGLALLDVADVIRPYPEVIRYLEQVKEDNFLEALPCLHGGKECREVLDAYLDRYGMRCSGEIDITKTRWSEKPLTLIPAILGNIRNFEPGAGKRKFEQGRQEALQKEEELLTRLRQLPDGEEKVRETQRMISLIRDFIGYREYPKYGLICRYFVYKQALMKEAEQLVRAGVLAEKEDVYFLSFDEFREAVHKHHADAPFISKRKEDYRLFEKLSPPRVMTSDGEIITGKYAKGNFPVDAIVGLAVSSGIIEGRARVILNMEEANLEEGDILVTSFTDPSWTPLFVSIRGLITEVGGLMTHGAVIAREYGLPAVVSVEHATRLIKDGQRIRVNGTEGYIEILD